MGRHTRNDEPVRRRHLALAAVAASFALVVSGTFLTAQAHDEPTVDPWAAAELVVNGGFEDGTAGWRTNDAKEQRLTTSADAFAGAAAADLSRGRGTGTVVLNDARNTVAATAAGQRFRASVAVRATQPRLSGQLRIREVGPGGVRTFGTAFYVTDDQWHVVRLDVQVRSGASLDLNVLAWKVPAGQHMLLDSVSLVEVDQEGSPVPVPTSPRATDPSASPTTSALPSAPSTASAPPTANPAPTGEVTAPPTGRPTSSPRPSRPTTSPPVVSPSPTPDAPAPPRPTPSPRPPEPTPPGDRLTNGCALSARGIPACGVLVGAAVGANSDPSPDEADWGATLGVRRTYWGPTQLDSAVRTAGGDLAEGRLPWISFKLPYSWEEMADGAGDAWARELVADLDALDGPVWLAFHHEPENDGDIDAWVAMQRHLSPIVRGMSDNVAFSVVVTGWHQLYGEPQYSLENIWPGDGLVDLLGFDIYNAYGLLRDGEMVTRGTDLATSYFPEIADFATRHRVAWGIAETGYTDEAAAVDIGWFDRTYRQMADHGGVALTYFDTTLNSAGSWRLEGRKSAAFAAVLRKAPALG